MMLWKDFAGAEDCECCPLLKAEICPGGFRCYGGDPIEPPCCYFDDDTDLDEWVNNYFERRRNWEAKEDARIKAEKAKKERAKKAADTRRAMRWYCRDEIQALKQAQERLESWKASERLASSFAKAINVTNEMFRYEERVMVRPEISERIRRLEAEVIAAKKKYDTKRAEFYAHRKGCGAE